ncbi:MAG: helix-turn-helix transcriptional regulator [Aeromonas sp.]
MNLFGPNFKTIPGHGLTARELGMVLLLAEGATNNEIEQATGMRGIDRVTTENSIKQKLGARTQANMIARAFSLGVIASRTLCLLLAMVCADYQDSMKQRTPIRGGRQGEVVVRIKTGGRNIWV